MGKTSLKQEAKRLLVSEGIKAISRGIRSGIKGGPRTRSRVRRSAFPRVKLESLRDMRRYNRAEKRRNLSRQNRMDIKKMKCFINSRTAVHVHRVRRAEFTSSNVKEQARRSIETLGNLTSIEGALGNLRYFDPSSNTMVPLSAVSGTYSRDLCIQISRKLVVKNNYHVPCHVQVWSCTPKDATGVDVETAFTGGLVDQGNPSNSSPLVYISDSHDLKNIWKINCLVDRFLQPGQSAVARANTKRFDYTIATNDVHTAAYQKKQGGHTFLLRVVGTLGHDSGGTGEEGIMEGGVDWLFDGVLTAEYDAGKDVHDYSIDDTSTSAFTNIGRASSKPIAGQQGYLI